MPEQQLEPVSMARMNALAVELMLKGKYDDAVDLLRSTLNAIKAMFREKSFFVSTSNHVVATSMRKNLRLLRVQVQQQHGISSSSRDKILMCDHFLSSCDGESNNNLPLFLYNRAMVLTSSDEVLSSSKFALNHATAVVLFNMALASHLKGPVTLDEAYDVINLYKMALSFSELNNFEPSTPLADIKTQGRWDLSSLIELASYNNMGYLYSKCFHFESASHCVRLMKWILSTVSSIENDGTHLEEEFSIFFINALVLSGSSCAPCA